MVLGHFLHDKVLSHNDREPFCGESGEELLPNSILHKDFGECRLWCNCKKYQPDYGCPKIFNGIMAGQKLYWPNIALSDLRQYYTSQKTNPPKNVNKVWLYDITLIIFFYIWNKTERACMYSNIENRTQICFKNIQ